MCTSTAGMPFIHRGYRCLHPESKTVLVRGMEAYKVRGGMVPPVLNLGTS